MVRSRIVILIVRFDNVDNRDVLILTSSLFDTRKNKFLSFQSSVKNIILKLITDKPASITDNTFLKEFLVKSIAFHELQSESEKSLQEGTGI